MSAKKGTYSIVSSCSPSDTAMSFASIRALSSASNRSSFLTAITVRVSRRVRLVDDFLRIFGRPEDASVVDNVLGLPLAGDLNTVDVGESVETGEWESPPSEALNVAAYADLGLVSGIAPIPARCRHSASFSIPRVLTPDANVCI